MPTIQSNQNRPMIYKSANNSPLHLAKNVSALVGAVTIGNALHDEFISSPREKNEEKTLRAENQDLRDRVSFLEGKLGTKNTKED